MLQTNGRTVGAEFKDLKAAADYMTNGAIEVNMYEKEIVDIIRRSSVFLNRVRKPPASGHPHRYFEQTAVATAAFTDPRNITPTPTGPTRAERAAMIKALTNQTNFSLFDVEVTKQQGQFAYLEAKDMNDIITSITILEAQAVWSGTDTSLSTPTTIQYVGLLTQITQQATVAPGASIIDGLKTQIATMVSNVNYLVRPTAIYLNGLLGDYIDKEAKAFKIDMDKVVVAGVQVNAIQTQAGVIPFVPDAFMPTAAGAAYGFGAPPAGNKNYFAVIAMEEEIEMPFISAGDGNPNPRLFQLGLLAGLQSQYVGIHFNSVIAKGPSYMHSTVCVQRP
ncbi:MAG: hypothetical protein GC190_21865 [Alphaproteobacteria bacterium]|nr:hypothetical protein [Alphaproteobacteria bacterium]